MKFIHAADLHIDSPMRGLQWLPGTSAETARQATRRSLENLVDLAITEEVDFILIAGDLFDGTWQHVETGLWTVGQFRRLERAGIPVVIIRGNHDAASKVRSCLQWPANVTELSTRKPQSLTIDKCDVVVHGQGFARAAVLDDLAATYPQARRDSFNVGLLHTSLAGHADHEPYAPTSIQVLENKGYDYWALGHIHARSVGSLSRDTHIAYSGNTQGRHVRETGPKGVLLVTVDGRELMDVQFRATDVLRWYQCRIQLETDDDVDALLDRTRVELEGLLDRSEDRALATRVTLAGACRAHRQLADSDRREHALAEIRSVAHDLSDEFWIEDVRLDLAPPLDLESVRESRDMLGQLFRELTELGHDDEQLLQLGKVLAPLSDRVGSELVAAGILVDQPQQLRGWLVQAERMLAAELIGGGDELEDKDQA